MCDITNIFSAENRTDNFLNSECLTEIEFETFMASTKGMFLSESTDVFVTPNRRRFFLP